MDKPKEVPPQSHQSADLVAMLDDSDDEPVVPVPLQDESEDESKENEKPKEVPESYQSVDFVNMLDNSDDEPKSVPPVQIPVQDKSEDAPIDNENGSPALLGDDFGTNENQPARVVKEETPDLEEGYNSDDEESSNHNIQINDLQKKQDDCDGKSEPAPHEQDGADDEPSVDGEHPLSVGGDDFGTNANGPAEMIKEETPEQEHGYISTDEHVDEKQVSEDDVSVDQEIKSYPEHELAGNESMKEIRAMIKEYEGLCGIKTSGKGRTKKKIIGEINRKIRAHQQRCSEAIVK